VRGYMGLKWWGADGFEDVGGIDEFKGVDGIDEFASGGSIDGFEVVEE